MASCFIALDPCTKENGCLQVLKVRNMWYTCTVPCFSLPLKSINIQGSHNIGRVEHVLTGQQTGAAQDRVEEIAKVLDLEYVIQEPGDALFFHCNILHRSDQVRGARPCPRPLHALACAFLPYYIETLIILFHIIRTRVTHPA